MTQTQTESKGKKSGSKGKGAAAAAASEKTDAKDSAANVPAVKQENKVSNAADLSQWGGSSVLSSNDVIIPRILLCQPMSQKVTNGEAAFGEFRESLNNELIGNFEKPFNVVPFYMEKVWIVFDAEDAEDKKFLRVVPITPANENLPYEDEEFNEDAGKKIKITRDRTMNFYVLRPEEIELGGAIPYIISARRTSLNAGKKLATQMFVKNPAAGLTPASMTIAISCGKQSQDKKTWAVMDAKPSAKTPDKHIAEAFKWLQTVQQGRAKAHAESYEQEINSEAREARSSGESVASGPAKF